MFKHFKGKSLFGSIKHDNTKSKFIHLNKKSFSNGINPLQALPPVTRAIVLANTGFFVLSWFMNKGEYIRQFFYHKYALSHNKYHVLITAHLANAGIFSFLIQTVFTGLLGSQLEMMLGSIMMKKLVLSSMGFGSILLLLMHKEESYFKTEAIFRGLIMYLVFSNPNQIITLFPFPLRFQAKWFGIFVVALDLMTQRYANFGGTIAAFALTRGLI